MSKNLRENYEKLLHEQRITGFFTSKIIKLDEVKLSSYYTALSHILIKIKYAAKL